MLLKIYQWICRILLSKISIKRGALDFQSTPQKKIYWFHAASAGELESLWPVILNEAKSADLILTVFSRSGLKPLERLKSELKAMGVTPIASGLSPLEGYWESAFRKFRPRLWITAKYEAWPEVWAVLSGMKIPLVVVGAQKRNSFQIARAMVLYAFRLSLPKILFTAPGAMHAGLMQGLFPASEVQVLPDPRWKRVYARSEKENPRARFLTQELQKLPKLWGILGSTWSEDLKLWSESAQKFSGTLWVVPHEVNTPSITATCEWLRKRGKLACLSSEIQKPGDSQKWTTATAVVVNEIGFLAELYREMDWVYIGGGFSQGVHSTIEPAIWGLPIACGPKKAEKFAEIEELQNMEQLTLIHTSTQLENWMQGNLRSEMPAQKAIWIQQSQQRRIELDRGISVLHDRLEMLL